MRHPSVDKHVWWNLKQHTTKSDTTELLFFDNGGDSHEFEIASYALELTPFVSAFNEA